MGEKVLIYDTDGANPYGREVGVLLGSVAHVNILVPVNTEWLPPGVTTSRVLPATTSASLLAQVARQLNGLVRAGCSGFFGRRYLVVIMTRGWYDQLFFSVLALLGCRVAVVAHDPVSKVSMTKLQRFSRWLLWKKAKVLLTHSLEMSKQAESASGRVAVAVPHLPFVAYAQWASAIAPRVAGDNRFLVLGQMRSDKGLDRLPAIFRLVQGDARNRMTVSFAGRGKLADVVSELAELVKISRCPSVARLSDTDIAAELACTDVLLAPYPVVSASGTVVLALSRGMRVVAYNTGALGEVIEPRGLVPSGDEQEFAARLELAGAGDLGGPRVPLEVWREESLQAWSRSLGLDFEKPAAYSL